MSLRRVSSRPRLVSDSDKAFVNATIVEEEDHYENDDDGYEYSSPLYYNNNEEGDHLKEEEYVPLNFGDTNVHDTPAIIATEKKKKIFGKNLIIDNDDDSNDSSLNNNNNTNSSHHLLSNNTKPLSNDSLSDYMSCSSTTDTIPSLLPRPSSPSLLSDLQSSFQKQAYVSSDEDLLETTKKKEKSSSSIEEVVVVVAATGTGGSTKRKRFSSLKKKKKNHYHTTTPTTNTWLAVPQPSLPSQRTSSSSSATTSSSNYSNYSNLKNLLTTIPTENIITIATYLTFTEIRTLCTTNHSIRYILMMEHGANVDIWLLHMKHKFPTIFFGSGRDNHQQQQLQLLTNKKSGSNNSLNMFNWDGSVSDELDSTLARMNNDDKSSFTNNNKPSSSSNNDSTFTKKNNTTRDDNVSLKDITFVDDYHLPIPGILYSQEDEGCYNDEHSVNHNNNNNSKVNLPLVSSLLPTRYPQTIDPKTLYINQQQRRRVGGHQQQQRLVPIRGLVSNSQQVVLFRTYDLMIDCERNATSTSIVDSSQDVLNDDDGQEDDVHEYKKVTASSQQQVVEVPVVQFTGTVGSGDRCIRSDLPFPPNCRRVMSSCRGGGCNNSSSSCHGSSCSSGNRRHYHQQQHGHSMSLVGGLFSFTTTTTTTSRRRRERRSRNNSATRSSSSSSSRAVVVSRNGSLSSTMSSSHGGGGLNQSTLSSPVIAAHLPPNAGGTTPPLLVMPSQHSPLYRFISSLSSHHCNTSPSTSSIHDESSTSQYGSTESSIGESLTSDERAIDESLNINYGLMMLPPSSKNSGGLMSKCKQCFGKLTRGGHYGSSRTNDNLRPFVVPTVISDTRKGEGRGRGGLVIDVTPRLVAYFEVTIIKQSDGQEETHDDDTTTMNNNENNVQLPNRIVEAPRRAGHRHGRHQVLAPVHLPFPMMAAAMVAEAQVHPAVGQPRQGNGAVIQQQQQQQRGQRHECVAIGLSTKAFSPHNRMPGWDDTSYGYHSDDGGIFHGQGDMLRRYGPSFGPGDTVGCGLEYSTRRIFFVKNGVFLGYAFDKCTREDVEMGLYPTVGVDTECPIFVNYGRRPFKFDLRGFSTNGTEEGEM